MTAIHLHFKSDVGTTYKRALERFHHSRDCGIPRDFRALSLIDTLDIWSVLTVQLRTSRCVNLAISMPELKALNDRAKQLRERKVYQLGELVIATGADELSIEQLTGLLLAGKESKDVSAKESWRKRGAAFFQRERGNTGSGDRSDNRGAAQNDGGTQSTAGQSRQN